MAGLSGIFSASLTIKSIMGLYKMVQSHSISTLTICGSVQVHSSWRNRLNPEKSSGLVSDRCLPGRFLRRSSSFRSHCKSLRRRDQSRVEARLPFQGGDQGLDPSSELSENANEDILIFFFKLDLATRVQCALNMEQYDIAQQLREKLTEVEEEAIRLQEAKRGSSSKSEAQDKGISIIRLRADLQNAIDSEDYSLAAKLRDKISKLEAESLAVSAKALAFENAEYAFRLGQKLRHKTFGYRAVVCGMDPVCCESSSWMEAAEVEKLPRGSNQPFYQVLVDVRTHPDLLVAYVPEDNLLAPEKPDKGRFDHPYMSFLFYGADTAGDFIPIQQLREKYNKPRHEVPFDSQDEDLR